MLLSELLEGTGIAQPEENPDVRGLCHDSRLSREGFLFFCLRGAVSDGHDFAPAAYTHGCRLFLAEHPLSLPDDAIILFSDNVRRDMAKISANFYCHPDRDIHLIGITGTKGKTSVAILTRRLLDDNGIPAGYIGTNGVQYAGRKEETHNTTPEAPELYRYLSEMRDAGVRVATIEVSSQAILMQRVLGLTFRTCIFTNLSPDHIGPHEHPDFDNYRDCKRRLFHEFGAENVIVNRDDPYAAYMTKGFGGRILTVSAEPGADYSGEDFSLLRDGSWMGIRFSVREKNGHTTGFRIPFPGRFSMYNAMTAVAAAELFGISPEACAKVLATVSIPGRFELIETPDGASVIIDYAHNGVSLSSLLDALRAYHPNRLFCLFGSVGGRTRGRRRELAEAAGPRADLCILTSDNPDNEPPSQIIAEIAVSFPPGSCPYISIPDRAEAIREAIGRLRPGDILALVGKGHETYQLVAGQYLPFSEHDIVAQAIRERSHVPAEKF